MFKQSFKSIFLYYTRILLCIVVFFISIMLESICPKALTDKIPIGLTKVQTFATYFIVLGQQIQISPTDTKHIRSMNVPKEQSPKWLFYHISNNFRENLIFAIFANDLKTRKYMYVFAKIKTLLYYRYIIPEKLYSRKYWHYFWPKNCEIWYSRKFPLIRYYLYSMTFHTKAIYQVSTKISEAW